VGRRSKSILSQYSWFKPHVQQGIKILEEEEKRKLKQQNKAVPPPNKDPYLPPLKDKPMKPLVTPAEGIHRIAELKGPKRQPPDPHSLSITIMGAPNAGKSTLVNYLVGKKVAAVSPKSQTTRRSVMGVVIEDNVQLVFYDTPGVVPVDTKKTTVKEIVTTAWTATTHCDLVCFIVDAARRLDDNVIHIMHQLEDQLQNIKKAAQNCRRCQF